MHTDLPVCRVCSACGGQKEMLGSLEHRQLWTTRYWWLSEYPKHLWPWCVCGFTHLHVRCWKPEHPVLVSFNCQLNLEPLEKGGLNERLLRSDWLWACLWKTVLIASWYRKAQSTVGSTTSWVCDPGCLKKATQPWIWVSEPARTIPFWFLLQLLASRCCLTSLNHNHPGL